jgi:uncharacterized protein YndB with AHSA1/START domain
MINIEFNTLINQPVDKVFAYLTDVSNETEWQSDLKEARLTSSGSIGVGSTGQDTRLFMGRETVTTWEVTVFEPNKKMAFKVVKGPLPFEGVYLFAPENAGTRFIYQVQAKTQGLARLFDPLVSGMVNNTGKKQMSALKRALERQA